MKKFCFNPCRIVLFLSLILNLGTGGFSQQLTQTIKGTVKDIDTQMPLPGATVVIQGTQPVVGAITDVDGNFRLTDIQVGRYNLRVSYVGYESTGISEVLVMSGKEVVLQIGLKESATALQQIEVKAYSNKEQPINPMAMISARQLNMEEASRYAGGIDDPARLATAFAGVAGSLSSNAIVIRGNAPKGLLWRMEGVEIPNPSHFANVTTFGGGGITALSSQMLGSSDFFTGAFPAEYGNALSGVFDMKIRNGNQEQREHTVKAGLIGLDYATEGPFVIGKKSSYLLNYRYSTLALISPLLPQNAQGIRYQDVSFKFNFPAGKGGTISAWGLFSADRTGSEVQADSTEWQFYQDIEEDENKNRMCAFGINHKIILSEKTYLNTALAVTGNYIYWHRERLNQDLDLYPKDEITQHNLKYTLSFLANHKFGPRHTNRTGLTLNHLAYHMMIKQRDEESAIFNTYADEDGSSGLVQLYSQSRFNIYPGLLVNAGIHAQWVSMNHDFSLEPRTSITWKFAPKQSLSIAYGLHSRLEPLSYYYALQKIPSGIVEPNRNLKLTKAHHLVLAYEWSTGEHSRLRVEPFYQKLYDVPVVPNSSFSMLNLDMEWFFNDSLVNSGTGRTVGVDVTMQRFLHAGYYYLITGSWFNARYRGGDQVERNTRFNKQYVVNVLFGKEWIVGFDKNNILSLNWKFSLLGGDRMTPVNQEASSLAQDVVYDEEQAFAEREPAVYYLDFAASWQRNKPKYSATWSLQFVNLLFQKEFYGYRYNFRTNLAEPMREVVFIPNISYRIDF